MTAAQLPRAVIRAEPDGYDIRKPRLMGRHAAGNGFLRAAVKARGDGPIHGYAPTVNSGREFYEIVRGMDPQARVEIATPNNLSTIAEVGCLYLSDITVTTHSRLRMRTGVASYSLCGVTHTTASLDAMDFIADLLREPVMPWDALVCTSTAVTETVREIYRAERQYQEWRFGTSRAEGPQLPTIPLGVHYEQYAFDADTRTRSRKSLGVEDDEIVGLYVGRLVYHAKAHPYPMFRGMQLAAEGTGKRLVLILAGWSPNETIAKAFREGAAKFAPSVRTIFVDGRDAEQRDMAWASGDFFLSLSDNIQETFGLTPIEAMAAGMPVVVSDWDGYRDTVRHEIDGFRVRTYIPAPGMGVSLVRALEAGQVSYDGYAWAAAASIAVDIPQTADAICRLVENPDLRRRMGKAGRRRARTLYAWDAIYRQYQDLWAELADRRRSALADPRHRTWLESAPMAASSRQDPFRIFGHYASATLSPETHIAAAKDASPADLDAALADGLFSDLTFDPQIARALFAIYQTGEATIARAAASCKTTLATAARITGFLIKLGLAVAR
jgi:glycosyltransferase involved in cell wall biosynthesis